MLLLVAGVASSCATNHASAPTTAPGPSGSAPGDGSLPTGAPGTTSTSPAGPGCRQGDPLANVYHPYRLQVQNPCLTVTGTVARVNSDEADGDVHMDLALPASETHLLDQANYSGEHGQLVTEIVPADRPGCTPGRPPRPPSGTYDFGTCSGAGLVAPPVGTAVSVTGPYVLDSDHGWMEIHPVWTITVLSQARAGAPTTGPTTSSAPAPSGGPGSAWCQASATPSNDGYPGDYEVYVRSDQPYTEATASDAGDTWSHETDGSGYVDIRLYHTSPGEAIVVTVGAARCSTTA